MTEKQKDKRYIGSKEITGLFQMILNNVPRYTEYWELFGGSAFIGKKLFSTNPEILHRIFDLSDIAVSRHKVAGNNFIYERSSGIDQLKMLLSSCRQDIFVYCDPPYVLSSRRSERKYYEFEWSDNQHIDFLDYARSAKFPVMISGYRSELYDTKLSSWRRESIKRMTRKGVVVENIWMNYDIANFELATYEYLGKDFTDRQRIKRRVLQMQSKFLAIPIHERQLLVRELSKTL